MKTAIYNQELTEWNLNAPYYELENKLPYRQIIYQEILKNSGLTSGHKQVLDAGCGAGHFTYFVQKQIKCRIVGLDFSGQMIKTARKMYPEINFICSSADKLPFKNNSQDAILAVSLLHHLKVQGLLEGSLAEFFRVLKPNGILCTVDRQDTPLSNLSEKIFATFKTLFKILKKNLPASGSSHEAAITQKEISLIAQRGFVLLRQVPICSLTHKLLGIITNLFLYTFGEKTANMFQRLTIAFAFFSERHLNSDWFSTERCLVFKKGKR